MESNNLIETLLRSLKILLILLLTSAGFMFFLGYILVVGDSNNDDPIVEQASYVKPDSNFVGLWPGPADWQKSKFNAEQQNLINYGKELIAHTADYLGPKGSVKPISNGMNCQNCHLQAGAQPWGNNYFAVQATYPKFRERSGTNENQIKRVSDCFERSLNGKAPDSTSREMKAILAYIEWLGTGVPKNKAPKGSGIYKLKGLKRATDPVLGKVVYEQKCQSCHQAKGEGVLAADGKSYTFPPLWGPNSYNIGAGLYRISNFAGYVKYNMPFGVTYKNPQLTDEEAWDVAAYVNSMPRPTKDLSKDWPNIDGKPFDHPFGPYSDPFTEAQHKYGPYKPIKDWKKNTKPINPKNLTSPPYEISPFYFAFTGILFVNQAIGQTSEKEHRIVFHLASADTLVHKALVKQLGNVLDYWKTAKIEVVVHNAGVGFMKKDEAILSKEIELLKE